MQLLHAKIWDELPETYFDAATDEPTHCYMCGRPHAVPMQIGVRKVMTCGSCFRKRQDRMLAGKRKRAKEQAEIAEAIAGILEDTVGKPRRTRA